jgi:predicted dehydrogenase
VDKRLKVAVIGVGYLGRHHARIYSEMPEVELVGVVDNNADSANRMADQYGTRSWTDYRELPDDLDAVNIATPTLSHFEISSHFVKRGVPVLVEKPMTATLDEAVELDRLVKEKGAILQVGHIERFNPAMMAVRDLKIVPKFIESHRLAPYKFRATDVGVVMDLMIHDIDIILELCDSPLKRVDAVGGAILSPSEDIANVRLEFESGCVVNVTASRVSFKSMRRTRIFASDCFISLDYEKKYALIAKKSPDLDMKTIAEQGLATGSLEDLKKLFMTDLINIQELRLDEYDQLQKELESFLDCVRNRKSPVVPSSHGVRAIRLAGEILEGIRGHEW